MLHRLSSNSLRLAVTFGVALASNGCDRKGKMDEAEVQRLIQSALERQRAANPPVPPADASTPQTEAALGGAPTTGPAAPTAQRADAPPQAVADCLSEASADHVEETARLLAGLKALMTNFGPAPVTRPQAPRACLTRLAAVNDPSAAALERSLQLDYQRQMRAAESAEARARFEFQESIEPAAWIWLQAWREGQSVSVFPGFSTDREPELTRRVRDDGRLHPEQPLYCSVRQASLVERQRSIGLQCELPPRISGGDDHFVLSIPAIAGQPGHALASLRIGDLVRIQGRRIIQRVRPSRGWTESRIWIVRDVDESGVSVVEPSSCCRGGASPSPSPTNPATPQT